MKLYDSNIFNKIVILRTDYNVPIINGIIQSTRRIDASLETLNYIISKNPLKIIIITHLGQPTTYDEKFSLEPVRKYLEKIIKQKIVLLNIDDIEQINNNKFIVLENIRFHKEETQNISTTNLFRDKLSNLGNIFINDAFGCCHRNHSSIVGINTPEKYLGFLVEKELHYLKNILLQKGKKTLILGGSKINDKIKLINNLIPKVDSILIGGGMAFTFLKYYNINIGNSLLDNIGYKLVPEIIKLAIEHNTHLHLPIDYICNNQFSNEGNIQYCENDTGVLDNYMALDIGQKTINNYKSTLKNSDIIIWNGPLGVFEFSNFENGSKQIMQYVASLGVTTVIGGGDIVSCCEKFSLSDQMTHISTGGGASLELLQGIELPGIEFINK